MPLLRDELPTFKGNAVIHLGDIVIVATDNVVFLCVARELGQEIAKLTELKMQPIFPDRRIVVLSSKMGDTYSYMPLAGPISVDFVYDGIREFVNGILDG